MIVKKCARCKRLIRYGATYCPDCEPIAEQERQELREQRQKQAQKRADQRRKGDPVTAFYRSADWLRLSKAYLQSKGYRCERCGRIAECVHHKHYIRSPGGWELRLDWDNLEALCGSCHAEEHGRKRRAPRAAAPRGGQAQNPGEGEKV
jgi:5-methylcytosine-specific restriction endonuclease McrA